MKVKRYDYGYQDGYSADGMTGLQFADDGALVKYEDYAALEARCAALAAENAGLKEYLAPVGLVVEGTPATDAFLAEVRAQGVEAAIATAKNVVAQEFQYKDFETAQRVCSKFPESDLVGKVEMVEWLADFAALLRKGGA